MKQYKLNGQTVNIPEKWSECTFIQLVRMNLLPENEAQVVSIFTGMSEDFLLLCKEVDIFEKILVDISFMSTDIPNIPIIDFITIDEKKYKVPKDLMFESVAQYEDMKVVIKQLQNEGDKLTDLEVMELYPSMIAIYIQPQIDGEYDYFKAQELANKIYLLPCMEVIGIGSFFLMKYNVLKLGTMNAVLKEGMNRRKEQRAFPILWKLMEWLLPSTRSQSLTTKKETTS